MRSLSSAMRFAHACSFVIEFLKKNDMFTITTFKIEQTHLLVKNNSKHFEVKY